MSDGADGAWAMPDCERCRLPILRQEDVGFSWSSPGGDHIVAFCPPCCIDIARWLARRVPMDVARGGAGPSGPEKAR